MAAYDIKCEIVKVATATEVCPGSARCGIGEEYILTARTPEQRGMCQRAFHALHPVAFAMRWSEHLEYENKEFFDVVCPDGVVTFRLSRIKGE